MIALKENFKEVWKSEKVLENLNGYVEKVGMGYDVVLYTFG